MRRFGLQLSANVRTPSGNRKELTSEERAAIVAARKAGVSRLELAENFQCDVKTITRTVERFKTHNTFKSLPRSGRPEKLNRRQKRYILQLVKRQPRIAWKALVGSSPVHVHKNTLRSVLGKHYRRKWRAMKRIQLTKECAAIRLAHARSLKGKDQELFEV